MRHYRAGQGWQGRDQHDQHREHIQHRNSSASGEQIDDILAAPSA